MDPGVGIARPEAGGPDSSGTHRRAPASVTRLIVFDGICTTAMNAFLIGPFLAAFALALGASHREIGLISAIAFLSMPMQLAGLYAVDRWNRRRGLIVSCALSARLLWILIVCLPFLPEKGSVRLLLAVLVCSGLIAAIPGPAWHSLVRNLLPVDSLGTIFSKRLAWGTVVGLTLTLAGGAFVGGHGFAEGYTLVLPAGQAAEVQGFLHLDGGARLENYGALTLDSGGGGGVVGDAAAALDNYGTLTAANGGSGYLIRVDPQLNNHGNEYDELIIDSDKVSKTKIYEAEIPLTPVTLKPDVTNLSTMNDLDETSLSLHQIEHSYAVFLGDEKRELGRSTSDGLLRLRNEAEGDTLTTGNHVNKLNC